MLLFRTFNYRLLPNKRQHIILKEILESQRQLYNAALQERISYYEKCQKSLTFFDQSKSLKDFKELYNTSSWIQRGTLYKLDKAFKGFFSRLKKGNKKAGFPRFKPQKRFDSFCFPTHLGFQLHENFITFKGIKGKLRFINSRKLPDNSTVCGILLKKDSKGWILSVNFKYEKETPVKLPLKQVGIDLGINHFAASSDGNYLENPKTYKKFKRRLKTKQREVARCQKGSNRRKKKVKELQRIHNKIKNTRDNRNHEYSKQIVKNYDYIVVEDLQIQNMMKNHKLAGSIADASWNDFITKLLYKAEEAGKIVIKVAPHNTSQHCSACGSVVQKELNVRIHNCPDCGFTADRDTNAALNILTKGGIVLEVDNVGDCFMRPLGKIYNIHPRG